MQGVKTSPCDRPVPIDDVAGALGVPVDKMIGEFNDLGWVDCNKRSTVPPIMADVSIDYFGGTLPLAEDDDPIEDPGPPAPLGRPYYAVGDGSRKDFVLV